MMVGLLGAPSAFAVKPKEPLHASFELKGSDHYEISGLGYRNRRRRRQPLRHLDRQPWSRLSPIRRFSRAGPNTGSASAEADGLGPGLARRIRPSLPPKEDEDDRPAKGLHGQTGQGAGSASGRDGSDYRGEGGYTSVHARRARGRVVLEQCGLEVCPCEGHQAGGGATGFSDHSVPPVGFTAFKPDHASATRFAVLSAWDPVPAKGATVTRPTPCCSPRHFGPVHVQRLV